MIVAASELKRAIRTCALLCAASRIAACAVYDESMLDGTNHDAGAGTGAQAGGGSASGGATDLSGGAPGSGSGAQSGGSPSTGGAATGGSSSGGTCTWGLEDNTLDDDSLLDDFDDNDRYILEVLGRKGSWSSINDQTGGVQQPNGTDWDAAPMSEREDAPGNFALHYVANGFDDWHLVMAELDEGGSYDLSTKSGISFWVRTDCAPVVAVAAQLRVAVSDDESFASSGQVDHPGAAAPAVLSTEWQEVKVPFSSLRRRFGGASLFDAQTARAIVFSNEGAGDLDVWIDDVGFYSP